MVAAKHEGRETQATVPGTPTSSSAIGVPGCEEPQFRILLLAIRSAKPQKRSRGSAHPGDKQPPADEDRLHPTRMDRMKYAFPILFVIVLLTPFVLQRAIVGDSSAPPSTGELRLVVITPHGEPIRREFGDAFSEWHRARYGKTVVVDYRNFGGGASDIVKYFRATKDSDYFKKTGSYGVDIAWGGGETLFSVDLKEHLLPVQLPPAVLSAAFPKPDIGGVPLYDKDFNWYGTTLGSFGIVYNKDILRHLGLPEPKTWEDLADSRYRGYIIMADPTRSSSARTAFMAIVEKQMALAKEAGGAEDAGWARGMGLIRQISANARVYTDASSSVPYQIGAGDAAAGMAIDFYGRTQVEMSGEDRVGYVEPAEATIVNPDPIAVVKGAANKDLAVRFIEFVLSPEGQRLWNYRVGSPDGPKQTTLRRLPIVPSVYDDMTHFTDKVNPFLIAGTFNTRRDRTKTFKTLGDQIQVSCIDVLSELRDARKAIFASPRAAELDARLGVFPYDQKEALKRQDQLAGTKESPVTPLRRLELIRQWEKEFKAEYRKLLDEAK